MRTRAAVFLSVIAILAVVPVSPSGAAATGVTCSKLTGTVKINPPYRVAPTTTVVTITRATLAGCNGPQGATALLSFRSKRIAKQSCHDVRGLTAAWLGAETIKWANGKSTNLGVKLRPSPPATFDGKATKGPLHGDTQKATLTYKSAPGQKNEICGLAFANFTLAGKTKFVIG